MLESDIINVSVCKLCIPPDSLPDSFVLAVLIHRIVIRGRCRRHYRQHPRRLSHPPESIFFIFISEAPRIFSVLFCMGFWWAVLCTTLITHLCFQGERSAPLWLLHSTAYCFLAWMNVLIAEDFVRQLVILILGYENKIGLTWLEDQRNTWTKNLWQTEQTTGIIMPCCTIYSKFCSHCVKCQLLPPFLNTSH